MIRRGFEDMMFNFMGQLDPFVKYPDIWSNIILDFSQRMLLIEVNIYQWPE